MRTANYFVKEELAPLDSRPVLCGLDAAYIPQVIAAIETRKGRSFWKSDDDFYRGSEALTRFQEGLLTDMSTPIVDAVNRVYMAVRQLSAGEQFSTDLAGLPPAIPAVPPPLDTRADSGLLLQLYDLQGQLPGGWFNLGARPATIADIVGALRQGTQSEAELLKDKLDLLNDSSEIATIYNTVKGTVADFAEISESGGILAVLVVSMMANIAAAQLQQTLLAQVRDKLQRLIVATDGGGLTGPATNVLAELTDIHTLLG